MEAEPPENSPTQASDSSGARPEAYASDRAASLRAMFPSRPGQGTPPPGPVPPFGLVGSGSRQATPPDRPAPRISRRLLVLGIAVLLLLLAGGVVANGIRRRGGQPARPPIGEASASMEAPGAGAAVPVDPASLPVAQGSPAVLPPAPPPSKSAPAARATTAGPARTAATKAASGPLTAYSACHTSSNAVYAVTFRATFTWHHVFIDTDATTATGYQVPDVGLGADYMVEDGTLYRSTGTDWGWSAVRGTSPLVSHAGGLYRWQVPLSAVGDPSGPVRSVFNGSGGRPDAYSPVLTVAAC